MLAALTRGHTVNFQITNKSCQPIGGYFGSFCRTYATYGSKGSNYSGSCTNNFMGKHFKITRLSDDGSACKIVLNINNTGSNLDSFAVSDVIPADSSSYGDPEGTVKNINYCLWFKPEIITTATWVRGGNSCANNMGCLFPQNSCISCGSDNFSLCVNSYCNMNSSRRPGGTGYRCACINFCPLNVLFTTCTMLK